MTHGSSLLAGDGVDVPLLWPWRLVWDTGIWPLEARSTRLSARLRQRPDQLCPLCHSPACCLAARAHSKFRRSSFLRSGAAASLSPGESATLCPLSSSVVLTASQLEGRPWCRTHPGSEPGGWQVARCSALNAPAQRRAGSEGVRVAREASEVAGELRDRAGQGREAGRMWHFRRKHARGCRRALLTIRHFLEVLYLEGEISASDLTYRSSGCRGLLRQQYGEQTRSPGRVSEPSGLSSLPPGKGTQLVVSEKQKHHPPHPVFPVPNGELTRLRAKLPKPRSVEKTWPCSRPESHVPVQQTPVRC